MTGLGFVLWLVVGTVVTICYDRRGLDRMPELLEFVNRSASEYANRTQESTTEPEQT